MRRLRDIRPKYLVLIAFLAGLAWILWSFFRILAFPDASPDFLGETKKVKLDPGAPVIQTFAADRDGLSQMKVVFGNTDLRPGEQIIFELADATCSATLASDTFQFSTPDPNIYHRFVFTPIPNSQGKTYCFKATYFSLLDRGDDRPYLAAEKSDASIGRSYTNTGTGRTYENRTLKIRPAYAYGSWVENIDELVDRLSQYKPAYMKELAIRILGIAVIAGSILIIAVTTL